MAGRLSGELERIFKRNAPEVLLLIVLLSVTGGLVADLRRQNQWTFDPDRGQFSPDTAVNDAVNADPTGRVMMAELPSPESLEIEQEAEFEDEVDRRRHVERQAEAVLNPRADRPNWKGTSVHLTEQQQQDAVACAVAAALIETDPYPAERRERFPPTIETKNGDTRVTAGFHCRINRCHRNEDGTHSVMISVHRLLHNGWLCTSLLHETWIFDERELKFVEVSRVYPGALFR